MLAVGAAFGVGEGLAVESGGEFLQGGGVGEKVAGELLDGELIKGEVGVDGVDDPIAIAPGVHAWAIFFVSITIGIASLVEPVPAPAFAKMRRGKQALDETVVGFRRFVVNKFADFLGRGGEPNEIITEPLDERVAIGAR